MITSTTSLCFIRLSTFVSFLLDSILDILTFAWNGFALVFKGKQVIFGNSVLSSDFYRIKFFLANPLPYSKNLNFVPFRNFVACVHFCQKYPSFLCGIYTCVYLGLMIYLACQNEIHHCNEITREIRLLTRITEVCTYYTSLYRVCQHFLIRFSELFSERETYV